MFNLMLGNDLVINENQCNQKCEYCLTGQSNLKNSHNKKLIFKVPKRKIYEPASKLGQQLHIIIERIDEVFQTPFLKISGGELFLIRGITDFIKNVAINHSIVVVQTNGSILTTKEIGQLQKLNNLVIQISLDSHLFFGNSYRVSKEYLHKKIITNISRIIESGLPIEIYSVLNDRNVTQMEEFAVWLQKFNNKPLYFPYPVRGPESKRFQVRIEQIKYIESFIKNYDKFSSILPTEKYFIRLLDFYQKSERQFRCYLPFIVLSTFNDGILTTCPNIWFNNMGNILKETWSETISQVNKIGLYKTLLANHPRLRTCKGCYTPWDLLSLYFDNEITLDELCISPTYAPQKIRQVIKQKKREFLSIERQ